jgi:hypothetical protein
MSQTPSGLGGRSGLLLSLLLLCLLECYLSWPVLLRSRILYERDLMSIWYPQAATFSRCFALGSWPLWDPWVGFGQSLIASDSQVAYPFGWLRLALAPPDYYALFVFSHFVLTGLGLLLFLRGLGLSTPSSFLGAASWMLAGPLVSLVNVWHHFASAAWMPWVLVAVLAVLQRPDLRRGAWLAAAVALQLLAGSADMATLTCAVAVPFVVACSRGTPGRGERYRAFGLLAASWLLGLGMAAMFWIPTVSVAADSARSGLPEEMRTRWAMRPVHFLEIASPVPLQDLPLDPGQRRTLFGLAPRPFLKTVYLGLGALAFVLAAVVRGPAMAPRWPWLVSGTGGILIAAGPHLPLYGVLLRLAPPLSMLRYPSKATIAVALSWSVLAALGAEALRHPEPARARWWRPSLWALGAAVVALALLGSVLALAPQISRVLTDPRLQAIGVKLVISGLFALLAVAALLASAMQPAARVVAAAGAILDLAAAARGINRDAPRSLAAFRPPVVDELQVSDHSRAYVYDYLLSPGDKSRRYLHREFPYVAAGVGDQPFLHELAAYEYAAPPRAGLFGVEGSFDMDLRGLQPRLLADLNAVLREVEGTSLHKKLLQIGAVSRVSALHQQGFEDLEPVASLASLLPDRIRVFRVPGSRPRTYAVGRARFASGPDEIRGLLSDSFDPATEVVVSGRGEPDPPAPFEGRSAIVSFTPDRVALSAELSRPGWVVLVDAYDPGWRATVDGESATIRRANAAFRAVSVPAGRHRIEMVYRPDPVKWGLLVSAAASGVALLLAFGPRPRAIRAADRGAAP